MKHGFATKPATWTGPVPTHCELCANELHDTFVNGGTKAGFWAWMCRACHALHGVGFGVGRGQEYSRTTREKVQG